MARGLNKKQTAVDAGVLDVAFTLGSELLTEICRVLVFDVLDNGIPATIVINLVTIARSVDNIKTQSDAILLND